MVRQCYIYVTEEISPEDLIIDVDNSLARQLYKKWERSVQVFTVFTCSTKVSTATSTITMTTTTTKTLITTRTVTIPVTTTTTITIKTTTT